MFCKFFKFSLLILRIVKIINLKNMRKNMMKTISREKISENDDIVLIDRKISIDKLKKNGAGDYYNQVKWKLSSKINKIGKGGKKIFINLIPKSSIKDLWIVRVLLTLQREITSYIVFPESRFEIKDIKEWLQFFKPKEIVKFN